MALAARDVIMKRDSVSGRRIRFIGIDGVYGDGAGLQAVADEKLEASFSVSYRRSYLHSGGHGHYQWGEGEEKLRIEYRYH